MTSLDPSKSDTPLTVTNAILGTAIGYSVEPVQRFAGTARAAGFTGEIILWRAASDAPIDDVAASLGVTVLESPLPTYDLQSFRYRSYLEFLAPSSVERVLLADVRDVVFFGDPFIHPTIANGELCLALEGNTIGNSIYNSAWIEHAFGKEALATFRNYQISCSGTTLGTRSGMLHYLQAMNTVFAHLVAQRLPIVTGLDQGVHNALLYAGKLSPDVTLLDNQSGVVQTVGYSLEVPDEEGVPRTSSGSIPCIWHQFDRLNVCDIRRAADRFSFPVEEILASRKLIQPDDTLAIWAAVIDTSGRLVAQLQEQALMSVELKEGRVPPNVLEILTRHYIGDAVILDWPALVKAILPPDMTPPSQAPQYQAKVVIKRSL